MADSTPKEKRGGPRPMKRKDDKRRNGAKRYNPEPNREKVRLWAKVHSRREIYEVWLKIDARTFRKHHEVDYQQGQLETTAAIGAKIIQRAMNGDGPSQRYYMDRRGGWHGRVEHTGPDGGPIEVAPLDLSWATPSQLNLLRPLLEEMLTRMVEEGEAEDE